MNRRQIQIQKSLLNNELEAITEIKKSYEKAINDIDTVIARLLARKDTENLQSIIYQIKYQTALKKELGAFLTVLQTNNYKTIDEYLKKCYEESHIGTLFDLQGQGVPLILPLDQEQMISAITLNSKLSEPLYNRLGYDVEILKVQVTQEVSRGIAQSLSYQEIARNLKNLTDVNRDNTLRIAKTEGHRIQNESAFNVQKRAKARGAKIRKEWDSTLDKKTRPTHRELDGTIIDVDDYFVTSNGDEALYPGDFGVAKEDIHCRCCLIQRAEWELTDDEFTKMNGETNELQHFENVDDYNEFKKIFWGLNK